MRTAVVRVGVDRAGELTPAQLTDGMARLRELAATAGIEVVENNLAALPPQRREVELLIGGDDAAGHETPLSMSVKKQVRSPVWQAGPTWSTRTRSVSPSQSSDTDLTY